MKLYKLTFYILFISIIWISCESDNISPEIQINLPVENTTFNASNILTLEALITDNKELDFVAILFTGPDDETVVRKIDLSGVSQVVTSAFELDYDISGIIKIDINAVDVSGNNKRIVLSYDFESFVSGYIDFNVKLKYAGEPLIMFQPYNYPDGKKIEFTRCSFYTSELILDETEINEVEFHNLTNAHSDSQLAINGYTWMINNVPIGNYNNLSFNIGVPPELNAKDPAEFPSGHPLAKPAENWFSWQSYIFLKLEGNIDLDNDGITETGVALHLGSDEALRKFDFEYPIAVSENQSSNIRLEFDLYDFFDGPTRLYPIEEVPQIHSLSQLDAVIELADNLTTSIHKQ